MQIRYISSGSGGGAMLAAGLVLAVVGLLWGLAAVMQFLYPVFLALTAVSSVGFGGIILPLSVIKNLRPRLVLASLTLSWICGAGVWLMSFAVIVGFLGWWAVLFVFLLHLIVPAAAIVLIGNGRWGEALVLMAGAAAVFGMRSFALALPASQEGAPRRRGETIDVTAEVDDKNPDR